MDSINTLRAILVGSAALAALVAAVFGRWLVAGVLAVAIAAHGAVWLYLYRVGTAAPPDHLDLTGNGGAP
jgi:hypothetical protein